MPKAETGFDRLARLIKEEGEEIRKEFRGELGGLRIEMNSRFTKVDQELSSVRSDLRSVRVDVDQLLRRTESIEKHLGLKYLLS